MKTSVAAIAALVGAVSARNCWNLTVPINISARNGVFNISTPSDDIAVTNFFLDFTAQGTNYSESVLTDVSRLTRPPPASFQL